MEQIQPPNHGLCLVRSQIYQQEISVRMEQMRRLTILQETKYASLGQELPQEMRQQLTEMHDLEKEVRTLFVLVNLVTA